MRIYFDEGGRERETDSEGEGKPEEGVRRLQEKKGECICPAGSKHRGMGVEA